MLQFPSVKAVLLSLEKPSLLFSALVGVSKFLVEKVFLVWIVENGKYCSTPYSTLLYDTQVTQEYSRIQLCEPLSYTGALQLKLSSPACLPTVVTATHLPACLVHCCLANRVYNGPDHLYLHTEHTRSYRGK